MLVAGTLGFQDLFSIIFFNQCNIFIFYHVKFHLTICKIRDGGASAW